MRRIVSAWRRASARQSSSTWGSATLSTSDIDMRSASYDPARRQSMVSRRTEGWLRNLRQAICFLAINDGKNMKKLRGALVGYGFIMERGHAAGYRARARGVGDVEIVAVADVSEARRELARRHFPGVRVYADHRALLAAEHEEVDFCDVATPPSDHAEVTHAALDRGLHVLCEKPLATSIDEARGMLRHATDAERVLYPCHNYKH